MEHFLSRVVIFYGEPLVTYKGSSFWIGVEWTPLIFPQSCLVLILLVSRENSPLFTLLTTRVIRAQNCESRSKSMILVEFLIPTYSYGCYGPGFTGILNSRPTVLSGSLGRIFGILLNFLSPLTYMVADHLGSCVGAEGTSFSVSKAFFKRPSDLDTLIP